MSVRNAVEKAREPGRAMAEALAEGKVNHSAILKAVGINPADPTHQAMLLVADKYGLDPLLGHVMILPSGGKPYITRDGYLHIAHASGDLDGIEVVDEAETDSEYVAKVSVWRKGMSRGFTYVGRYPKGGKNREFAREMAVTRAERRAMKRAFDIAGDEVEEVDDIAWAEPVIQATATEPDDAPEPLPALDA